MLYNMLGGDAAACCITCWEVLHRCAVHQYGSSLSSLALALPTAVAQEAWDGLTQFSGSLLSSRLDLHCALVRQVLIAIPTHPGSSRQMCVPGLYLCTCVYHRCLAK